MHGGAGTRSAYCDVALRHSVNELEREAVSAVDILVPVPHTPQILNGPHNMQCKSNVCGCVHGGRMRGEEVRLGFTVFISVAGGDLGSEIGEAWGLRLYLLLEI